MNHGTRPTKPDHRDFDLVRTFGGLTPTFPETYLTGADLWTPDQNSYEPVFKNSPLPYGCTDYSQADLVNDMKGSLTCNPIELEKITHANANGGADIRQSLKAARQLGWIDNFFNIRSYTLDYFDSFRYAQIAGVPEKRSISFGCPWFPSWEKDAKNKVPILSMPTDEELKNIRQNANAYPWHNSKLDSWVKINGITYYRNISWQGSEIGDNGKLYFSREIINTVMSLPGTVAFTATIGDPNVPIKKVDLPFVEWLMSVIRTYFPFSY